MHPSIFSEIFEEEFKEVAHSNNLLLRKGQQQVEPSQVEPMLHEAIISKANLCVLFHHLSHFSGSHCLHLKKLSDSSFLVMRTVIRFIRPTTLQSMD